MPFAVVAKIFKPPTAKQMGIEWVRLECLNELRNLGRDMEKDLNNTFNTFSAPKPKVKSAIHLSRTAATASIDLEVEDPKGRLQFLEPGTKGHVVTARRAKAMRWRGNFRPKTSPRWLGSRAGGQSGSFKYSKRHWVKGIKPREYSKTLQKKWEGPVSKRLEAAARRGARKAG